MGSAYIQRLIVSLCFLGIFRLSEGGQLCGSCDHISDPRGCNRVTSCGDHEECMVSQYVTTGGHVMYDVGCMASFRCHNFGRRESGEEKVENERSSHDGRQILCQSCCNDTKICNTMHGLCNSQPLDTSGYILCYNCDQMSSPNQCDRITRCHTNQQCYLGEKLNLLSGARVWESRCGNDVTECTRAANLAIIGKRQTPYCGSCCNDANFCNADDCSGSAAVTVMPTTPSTTTSTPTTTTSTTTPSTTIHTSPTPILTKPIITSISSSQQVVPGASIYLHCAAGGNPFPTINWGVTHFSGYSSKPTNTHIMNSGRTMFIDHFVPENAGLYICIATNSEGSQSRVVSLSVAPVPSTQAATTVATTSSPNLSRPVIQYATNIHHARIGSNVRLLCLASGHPTPQISWTVLTSNNVQDNVSLVGLELHIDGFRQENYGTYRCVASNSVGEAYKYFTISPYQ